MQRFIGLITAFSLCASQLAGTVVLAQTADDTAATSKKAKPAIQLPQPKPMPKPMPQAKPTPRPEARPLPQPMPKPLPKPSRPKPLPYPPPTTKPAPPPGGNWGGSGGSGGNWGGSGGNWGGSGGSGGNWGGSGGSGGNWGGSGGSGGNWGGSGGSWGDNWNDWHGRIVRCESWNYRYARCNLDTRGGVRMTRLIAGDCRQGRSWGYDTRNNYVWVDRGCRADFQARYGSWQGNDDNNGPSTGAVVAGVAVAAGLIAILASKGKKADTSATTVTPASINIGTGAVPAAAEQSFRLCLNEAARQIGATGGSSIRLLGAVDTTPGNGGWRFQMPLESSFPGDTHATPAFCRATNTQVVELSFYQS